MKIVKSAKQLNKGDIVWHKDNPARTYTVLAVCPPKRHASGEQPCVFVEDSGGRTGHFGPWFYRHGAWRYKSHCMFDV